MHSKPIINRVQNSTFWALISWVVSAGFAGGGIGEAWVGTDEVIGGRPK